jgi:uncharacterized protein (DUF362 family)/ferredoxin
MNRVSVISTPDYSPGLLDAVIGRHMAEFRMDGVIRPGMKVLLKPNLLMKSAPEKAVTTQPELVAAVIRWLQARDIGEIVIADSPGGPYTKAQLEGVYRACGMERMANGYGVRLNLDTSSREVPCPGGKACRAFTLISPVCGADVIINLARLKTHGMTMLSGAVKNMFGAVPGLQKPELHLRFKEKPLFASMLVDLSLVAKPSVSIVDAVVSMEGDGPSGGVPRRTGVTFAGVNPHALDLALCDFIGMPAGQVCTVAEAIRRGFCPASAEKLDYRCDGRPDTLSGFRFPSSKPLGFEGHVPRILRAPVRFVGNLLTPLPAVKKSACIGCGKCAESCAPRAAVIRDGKAVIDHRKCIGCFCCQEMCPVKAIEIKRSRFLRF